MRTIDRRQTVRVVVAGLLVVLSGALAGRVFARPAAAGVALCALPSIVITSLDVFPRVARWFLHLLAVPVVAAVATAVAGGRVPERTIDGISRGWNLATSTDWPSPMRSELIAFAGAAVAVAAAITVETARSNRWRSVTLIPPLLLSIMLIALAAPDGPPPTVGVVVWLGLAGSVLALAQTPWGRPPFGDEWRGERRSIALLGALALVGGVIVAVAHPDDRADPRLGATNPAVTNDELNPLAQVAADRLLERPEPRFSVDGPIVGRWRTTVLDRFDGVTWTTSVAVRPVSRDRITDPDAGGATTGQTITVEAPSLVWLPVSGIPVSADRFVESDVDRSVLAADRALVAGEQVTITSKPGPSRDDVTPDSVSRRQLDDEAAQFSALALSLGGSATSLVDRLDNVERALRDDFRLAPDTSIGSNARLLQLALTGTRQATPEQFVAAFVLMARSFGATARIAIGYDAPADGSVVTSAESVAWPEVYFDDIGWVSYDPVPEQTGADTSVGDSVASDPAQLAPPPPANPPSPDEPPPDAPEDAPSARAGWVGRAISVGSGVGGVVLLLGLAGLAVIGIKARRRRRRLGVGDPRRLVLGAWAEATDHLVSLGARLSRHQTNAEMVLTAGPLVPRRAIVPLGDLAGLANGAAHGLEPPDPIVAAHAVRLLGQVEQSIGEDERRRRRWRRRLSLRPLRRSTRSPVR